MFKKTGEASLAFTEDFRVYDMGTLIAEWRIDGGKLVMPFVDKVDGVLYFTPLPGTKGWSGKNIERPDEDTWL